jgi:hypothetical protein
MSAVSQANSLPPPSTIREVTWEVLARAEFTEPSRWYDTLFEFIKTIKEWLDRLSAWSEANPTLARVCFALAILLLIACLVHLLYLALADLLPSARKQSTSKSSTAPIEILAGAANDWREALQLARQRLAENDLRRAIWIAHRVLLGLLDQQGAIKFAGWKTNTHYLGECAPSHPWYPTFSELTEIYERAVYARRGASAEIAEALLGRVDRLHSEACRPA